MDTADTFSGTREQVMVVGNTTLVCQGTYQIPARSVWHSANPLQVQTTLLLFQLSALFISTRVVHVFLKPLGQLSLVSQLFGGILLGPSLLGHANALGTSIFPERGIMVIETFTSFGVILFLFGLGVKMDPKTMLHPGRKAAIIGSSVLIFSIAFTTALAIILKTHIPVKSSLVDSLPYVACAQALTGFPVISTLLSELKLRNTDLGRLAISTAMFCDFVGIGVSALGIALMENRSHTMASVFALTSAVALLLIIIFLVRPLILWMIKNTQPGKPMKESYLTAVLLVVFMASFVSETVGQHYVLGPLFIGLVVPDGPPLGTAIESRLEAFVSGLLYPAFVSVSGLQTDVFQIQFESFRLMAIIVIISCATKFVAVISSALYNKVPLREATVLALMLNGKGIIELVLFNLWRNSQVVTNEVFALCIMATVLVTGITTPLVKFLYDPSTQFVTAKRSTIQHSKPDSEFRIIVCIHSHESVPTIINLLEISHAYKHECPIVVMMMVLVELMGRTTPILVNHKERTLENCTFSSSCRQILNAFRNYEHNSEGRVAVETFTVISDFENMHVDVCQVALEERANIVIVPFHKQWAVDGMVATVNRAMRTMNLNFLEKVPCSLGILIDRGIVTGSLPIVTGRSVFHVAVLFIGGPDDAESLAYGCRMLENENVVLTVIRFLLFGNENTKDRRHDSDIISEYRQANMGNERFVYLEEVVRDGVGLSSFVSRIVDQYDLILVGRQHQASSIFTGLEQWSECPELGVIPDMLASSDFVCMASVLVIQQQRLGGNLRGHSHSSMQPARESSTAPGAPQEERQRMSLSISIEKVGRS